MPSIFISVWYGMFRMFVEVSQESIAIAFDIATLNLAPDAAAEVSIAFCMLGMSSWDVTNIVMASAHAITAVLMLRGPTWMPVSVSSRTQRKGPDITQIFSCSRDTFGERSTGCVADHTYG